MAKEGSDQQNTEPVPRGPRSDTLETVFTWAFRLLIEEGSHAITAHRLHKESGIARTTIYRHWPETSDLLAAMLDRATGDQDTPDFTGDLRGDLTAAAGSLIFRFNNRPVRALFGALVEHSRKDPETDLAASYIDGLLQPMVRAITDWIERGALEPGDVDDLVAELSGPLLMRHIMLGHTVTEVDADRVIDAFIDRHQTTETAATRTQAGAAATKD